MIYRKPWLVNWLLKKTGKADAIALSSGRFVHDWWINGLNFLLTFGAFFALVRLLLGPPARPLIDVMVVMAGSVIYGLAAAHAGTTGRRAA